MEAVIEKIKSIRKKKGYSHKYMALELDMSQPAYSKIENHETKLSVDRLFQIAEILETNVEEFLDVNPNNIYNQTNNDTGTFIGHQEVQNLYQENKEKTEKIELLYESWLKDKEEMNKELIKIINKLK
jgi:transcriptional regulator with XRE-family HTH domain